MPTILSKLKDGTFKIGNLFIDKGVRWLECIDKRTNKIDSYILESTWYMETHPIEKAKFAQQVYAFCNSNDIGINNKTDMQIQQEQITTKESERIKKEDERIASFFENSRRRGRSPLTITKPPQ